MKRRVVQVTQSPMNPQRWVILMECGHEEWITRRTKPTLQKSTCNKCPKEKAHGA